MLWTSEVDVAEGQLFRPVNPGDQVCGLRMSEKVLWQMLKTCVVGAGLANIAPHDLKLKADNGEVVPGSRQNPAEFDGATPVPNHAPRLAAHRVSAPTT